ncbi:hypothetical protein [Sphingobacterium thermophilum]|uniref:Uncharacterized protein n=1 Tax=Sphingobacterium thermophilum TaxID=768534 RepID=A0ABP8R2P6_9SPHI
MKLTPLNITLAVVLLWVISEWQSGQEMLVSWGWLVVWIIVISLIDLGFRLVFEDLSRLWIMQVVFMLLVGILIILLKLQ